MGPERRGRERPVEDWEFPVSPELGRLAAGEGLDLRADRSARGSADGRGGADGPGGPADLADPADPRGCDGLPGLGAHGPAAPGAAAPDGPAAGARSPGPGWSSGIWPRARAELRDALAASGDHEEPDCLAFPAVTRPIHRRGLLALACTPSQVVALGSRRLLLWIELLGVGAEIPLDRLCLLDRSDEAEDDRGPGGAGAASLTLFAPGRELTLRYHPLGGPLVRPFAERVWDRAHAQAPVEDGLAAGAGPESPAAAEVVRGEGPLRPPWPLPRAPFALTVTPRELLLRFGPRTVLVDRTRIRTELCDRRDLLVGVGDEILGLPFPPGLRDRIRAALERVPPGVRRGDGGGGRGAR
ncbi:hypothetical protein [Phaeacidiphilus oryzae]|uniref:hypothetical protein n=1 Tax=Phaeacidiphilus oryzae TaxID=348818 RepID=UPI00056D1218|nr:hypothetical protein [Phaeacidiphilus oryzae]